MIEKHRSWYDINKLIRYLLLQQKQQKIVLFFN